MTPEDTDTREPRSDATGSVAEEAALLVDLLSSRGWGGAGAAADQPTDDATDDATDETGPEGASASSRSAPAGDRGETSGADAHECTCGGRTPAACAVCPVCQLIAFVQRIEPDAIERFADVVGLAATALRDLATAQRERRDRAAGAAGDDGKGTPE
ncbi:hypothetical protein [Intrasporangium sp. YIM S08009]|uniref:hypothetical protein n=1 Tax=Intrasporangium zincisolvens TaxID=3080018 RepID=UPI002B05C141|nr:hypothetical protein [Intrasporangium sp. YIM S08009]